MPYSRRRFIPAAAAFRLDICERSQKIDILNKITGKVLKNCEEAQILFAKELVQGAKIADSECLYQLTAAVRTRHPVMEKIGLIVDDDDYLDFLTEAVLLGNDKARLELALLMYVAGGIPWEGERRPETDEEWCDELIEAVDEALPGTGTASL